ncbi:hypothetical protein GCM10029978_064490 [Actinoallomurus acanthiterrae]
MRGSASTLARTEWIVACVHAPAHQGAADGAQESAQAEALGPRDHGGGLGVGAAQHQAQPSPVANPFENLSGGGEQATGRRLGPDLLQDACPRTTSSPEPGTA